MSEKLYFRIEKHTTLSGIADMERYADGKALNLEDDMLVLEVHNPDRLACVIERAESFGWHWLMSPPTVPDCQA